MTSYKSQYGITLKQAKQIAIANNGHLPKCGYETVVKRDTVEIANDFYPHKRYYTENNRTIYLANSGGSFILWDYIDCNPIRYTNRYME